MSILYSGAIFLYGLGIRIAAFFSQKAREWVNGRKNMFARLSSAISGRQQWIWIHAASLGEFEQGRPLLELLRDRHPDYGILLTFFSPSGYLVRKDYTSADVVTYMPLDTARNARRFVEVVNPAIAIFVKYDIWYHHLLALEKRNIPTFLISAHLRKEQIYFWPIAGFLGQRLRRLTHIFTQTMPGTLMLKDKGFGNVICAGDSRLDRVLTISSNPRDFSWLKQCLGEKPVLVAGSTWPADEQRLFPAIRSAGVGLIIAPHEIHDVRLREIELQLPGSVRMSQLKHTPKATDVVVVDTFGDLAHLYAMGDIAYVGGGFGAGIHNILEPIAHGIPVIIGPRFQKFSEANTLVKEGAVSSIRTSSELEHAIHRFLAPGARDRIRDVINNYVESQRGATERIYAEVKSYL